jgi:hypothetical protein
MALITRPPPAQPANSQKTGNGQWSEAFPAPVSATKFEERPSRGAKSELKFPPIERRGGGLYILPTPRVHPSQQRVDLWATASRHIPSGIRPFAKAQLFVFRMRSTPPTKSMLSTLASAGIRRR